MSREDRQEKMKSKKACFTCFKKGHGSKDCKSFLRCLICSGRHHALMCKQLEETQRKNQQQREKKKEEGQTVVTNLNCTSAILLKTVRVRAIGKKKEMVVRLLLDEGSQRSYIRESIAKKLNLKPLGEELINKSLFSGQTSGYKRHNRYEVTLEGLDRKHRLTLSVIDEPIICGKIPSVQKGQWMDELTKREIVISECGSSSSEIDILVGSDHWGKVTTFEGLNLESGLTAMNTVFGWTLSGRIPRDSVAMTVTAALFVNHLSVADLWNLDTIGIKDSIESITKSERDVEVIKHFSETVKRKEDGRYSVSLPWTHEQQRIPSNRSVAEKRLLNATTKLKQLNKIQEYDAIFKSWEEEGIVKTVKLDGGEYSHFLPHRAIFKPESLTTPIRPVFDASCKVGRNPSLNECLEKGPNLLDLIPSILLRFREQKIGLTSDIRKAFQMIEVDAGDRRYQRFLWWENESCKNLKVYEHQRVVFGINCSPFLLQAVLRKHLDRYQGHEGELSNKLLRSLYVDNCITSVRTFEEYEDFKTKCVAILKEAKMELRQWERTGDESGVGQSSSEGCRLDSASLFQESTSVLGLKWNKRDDMLSLDIPEYSRGNKVTKRGILSQVQRVFDPIGFSSPATITPKIMLQELWVSKLGWDDEVSGEIGEKFLKWSEELPYLTRIKIPRQVIIKVEGIEIHVFGDASKDAYAAAVFIRNVVKGKVIVRLAQAKARVSPLKKMTIPRLELMACLIGSRLVKSTKEALGLGQVKTFLWSDSMTALTWIRRNDDWGTFVGNRVREILTLTDSNQWKHIPGRMNPADFPSRGCSPSQLLESRWWEGPEWLKMVSSEWPVVLDEADEEEVSLERRKTSAVNVNSEVIPWFVPRSTSYIRNVRILAWMRRFFNNSTNSVQDRTMSKFLGISEIRRAEIDLVKIIQKESLPEKIKEIKGILVFKCEQEIIRLKTKLLNKRDTDFFRAPILLPKDHPLVQGLIEEIHRIYGHLGTQALLGKIREKYWIQQGRRSVNKVIHRCIRCRRHQAKNMETEAPALPIKRVTATHSFQTTGVDLAGPLFLKNGEKVWIVLYTCAVYRCVTLDLVSSLSTGTFLGSLERFVSLFGRPDTVYTDNGTNFVGTANLFKQLDKEKMLLESEVKKIQWIFNPPTASWWGGWWERLVRSVKDLIKRMLGRARLDEESLRTCLASVSAAINNRPLTTLTEDPDDLIALTPSMFLRGPIDSKFPEKINVNAKDLQRDYKKTAVLRKELESRFRKEYLGQLVQRAKERNTPKPKVGDIVLVGADGMKRIDWPMGRIMELIQGSDGNTRLARVQISKGILLRPLQRLFPMEVSNPEEKFTEEKASEGEDDKPEARSLEELMKGKPKTLENLDHNETSVLVPLPIIKRSRYGRELKQRVSLNV